MFDKFNTAGSSSFSSSAYFCRFDGDGATSSAIDENSIRFFGGTERSLTARSTGGVGVDFREKSVGVDDADSGTWLEMAKSAALKLYFGIAGLSRSDFVGVERFSEGDDKPIIGGGVSILLEDELDEDLGGFISRVLRASCWSFINDGDR